MNPRLTSVFFLAAALGTSAFVPLSAADQAPKAVSKIPPVYAYDLRKNTIEGAVVVSFDITAQGNVANAAVISSTHRVFEQVTLDAIRHWKFTPGMKDGVAVSTPATQLVTFTLPAHKPETTTIDLLARLQPRLSTQILASIIASDPELRLPALAAISQAPVRTESDR